MPFADRPNTMKEPHQLPPVHTSAGTNNFPMGIANPRLQRNVGASRRASPIPFCGTAVLKEPRHARAIQIGRTATAESKILAGTSGLRQSRIIVMTAAMCLSFTTIRRLWRTRTTVA